MTELFGAVVLRDQERSVPLSEFFQQLGKLAFRGGDGVGVLTKAEGAIRVAKTLSLPPLAFEHIVKQLGGHKSVELVVGEVRFATHGRPSIENTPPHHDCMSKIYVFIDGVVGDYDILSRDLRRRGHVLLSKNDAELLAHIAEERLDEGLLEAATEILSVRGYFTSVLISEGGLAIAGKGPKLFVGMKGETLVFSTELEPVAELTEGLVYRLPANSVLLVEEGVRLFVDGREKRIEFQRVAPQSSKVFGGYNSLMEREIFEIPDALRRALYVHQRTYLNLAANLLIHAKNILITGSGTSHYAGLIGSYYLSKLAKLRSEVIYATEFIFYGVDRVTPGSVVIAISQSGKSTDVLRAVREARIRGGTILGITNNIGSPLMFSSNVYLPIGAGPEKAVPATKTFECQLLTLLRLAVSAGLSAGALPDEEAALLEKEIFELPSLVEKALAASDDKMRVWANYISDKHSVFLASRGLNYPIALEGALKLKETAYIHAEGLEAGELRHGPKAIISEGFPVIIVVPNEEDAREDSYNLMMELKELGAKILAITSEADKKAGKFSDDALVLPETADLLTPMLNVIPLQLLALRVAELRGLPIDEPRGLAKYVIVKSSL